MHKTWPVLFLSLAAGVLLVHYHCWVLMLAVLAAFLLIAAWSKQNSLRLFLVAVFLLAGGLRYQAACLNPPLQYILPDTLRVEGTVADLPYYDGQKTVFTLKNEDQSPHMQRIRVVCLFPFTGRPGDTVCLQGELKRPKEPGNPGQFDFPAYLVHQGIFYNLTVKVRQDAGLASPGKGLRQGLYSFRARAEELTRQALPSQEASILLGMLLGGRAGMEDQQYLDFQKTGIIHLFSVGGLHVAFLLLLVEWLHSLFGASRRTKLASGVAVLMIYATMIGWPAPVVRAVIMAVLCMVAYYSGRETNPLNFLAMAGIVLMLIDPHNLFSLSFQLTFMATWGLVYLFPLLRKRWPVNSLCKDLLLLPLAAELAVLPLVAYHFNLFSPVSIITNIFITYLAGAAVILGFCAFLLAPLLPSLAMVALFPAGMCIEAVLFIVGKLQVIPGAYCWVANPGIAMVIIYYGALGMLCRGLKTKCRRQAVLGFILFLVFIGRLLLPAGLFEQGYLEVSFIDVGQGDAILIKSPRGRFLLVDGGGSHLFDVGTKTVLPYLHHRGIRHLDMIINTHPDIDHLQGLESVAREMKFDYLGIPASLQTRHEYQALKKAAASTGARLVTLSGGQNLVWEEGLDIRILHPERGTYTGEDMNGQSVVLELRYQDFSVLLCGDIPSQALSRIVDEAESPATLVKIPHHGSKGSWSKDFYERIKPRVAVISAGEDNPFGHPAAVVIEGLEQAGIEIMRTDQDGAVTVKSDGRNWTVTPTRYSAGSL